ncbi:hypothetical protein [Streptomyces sp. NPDC046939]|uniref:hypothetical protein n=1 Tax=Streptomyces sp. NPDC046939 TaxID=3155376 RepID=UPI0033E2930E
MSDDALPDDPLGVALSVLTSEERRRVGEITAALAQAADAALRAPGWTPRPAADAWRELAAHYRARGDGIWPALSAAADRAASLDDSG